ncbi:MAG: hypothetical protein PHO34_04660 [Candidatus Omnitrophica bacterium]|nr:hypothetical protein [Candidatus Omnitrophota bacterium]MDD5043037.1 hypothetical protein [Candidatus Omnitrophota bacterium]MDD5501225.1 hypothetical protein [Candidatus Omnitrophota bacterium]
MLKSLKAFLAFVFLFAASTVAASAEDITITTYYPSPYGSYNELQLYPHSSPTVSCNSSKRGTMYYDSDDNNMYVCNGTSWLVLSKGSAFTYYCFSSSAYGSPVCTNYGGSQGYCPSGYTQQGSLGAWGRCYDSSGNYAYMRPPGGSCGGSYSGSTVGNAYVCSQ